MRMRRYESMAFKGIRHGLPLRVEARRAIGPGSAWEWQAWCKGNGMGFMMSMEQGRTPGRL